MNKPTSVPPNGGGGVRQRLLRGTLLKWSEVDGYFDRDGVRPVEGPYLLWAMENGYQRWKAQILVDEIIDKPLPDLDQLNGAIPKSEWEPGLDGHPRIPYSHQWACGFGLRRRSASGCQSMPLMPASTSSWSPSSRRSQRDPRPRVGSRRSASRSLLPTAGGRP